MPYKLKKKGGKCKVTSPNHPQGFSKKWLPCDKAKKQLAALHIHTNESINKSNFLRRLNESLEGLDKIVPKDIYSFYLVTYLLQTNNLNTKYAHNEAINFLDSLKSKYIKNFSELIIDQLKKYAKRGRLDKDAYSIEDLDQASPIELDIYMKSTYRSDMRRRNTVWESLTSNLKNLYLVNDTKTIVFYIDRVNNDIHNTGENTISKLEDGYTLWHALEEAHTANPKQLIVKSHKDIADLARLAQDNIVHESITAQ